MPDKTPPTNYSNIPVPETPSMEPAFGENLPSPEDAIPKTRASGLLDGESLNNLDICSPWDNALESNADDLEKIMKTAATLRHEVRDRFTAKHQSQAHDDLDAEFLPKIAAIGKRDLSLARRRMEEFRQLFVSRGFVMDSADAKRLRRSAMLQARWVSLGTGKDGHLARRDLFLSLCAEGDSDVLFSVLDLPTLERRLMFNQADITRGIRLHRQASNPKEAEAVRSMEKFLDYSRTNLGKALEKARISAGVATEWEAAEDGGAGFTKMAADAAGLIEELPAHAKTLTLAMSLHQLRVGSDEI